MYTKLKIVFSTRLIEKVDPTGRSPDGMICILPEHFDKKCMDFLEHFETIYGKYRTDHYPSDERQEYALQDNQVDFEDLFDLMAPYDKEMDVQLFFERKFEDQDYEGAAAYILRFPKKGYFYDDWPDSEKYESQANQCPACWFWSRDNDEYSYIKPDDGVSKLLTEKMGGIVTPNLEPVVSQQLRAYLLEAGIDEIYFRPARTKSEKLLGYKFYGGENILPPDSVKNRSILLRAACPLCGRVAMRFSGRYGKPVTPLHRRFSHAYGDYPLLDETVIINTEGLRRLKEVNWTHEFFWENRYVIVNEKVFDLVTTAVPRAKKASIPVFHSDEKLEYGVWAIPIPGQKKTGHGFRKPFEKKKV